MIEPINNNQIETVEKKEDKAKKTEETKNSGGRPSKYKEEYASLLIKFFSKPLFQEIVTQRKYELKKDKNDKEKKVLIDETRRIVPNDIPFDIDFIVEIDISVDTFYRWAKKKNKEKYPGFYEAYKKTRKLQEQFLALNAIQGRYDTTFAIFTAKNILKWRNQEEIDVKSAGKQLQSGVTIAPPTIDYSKLSKLNVKELRRIAKQQSDSQRRSHSQPRKT